MKAEEIGSCKHSTRLLLFFDGTYVLGRNGILLRNSNLLRWICHKFLSLFLCSDFPMDQMHLNKFII